MEKNTKNHITRNNYMGFELKSRIILCHVSPLDFVSNAQDSHSEQGFYVKMHRKQKKIACGAPSIIVTVRGSQKLQNKHTLLGVGA